MATITYKNQPAIHATRGSIPLAGNSYVYTVSKLLWPKDVENFLNEQLIPVTLHVCCGKSQLGDVRLDLYEPEVDICADAARLPFGNESFDTVISDALYNSKFQWDHDLLSEMARVAKNRIIHQNWFLPADKWGRYKKDHSFLLTGVYIWQPKTYFGRVNVISVFDRIGEND